MRVSKTVREYISDQVYTKLKKKYDPIITAEQERQKRIETFCDGLNDEIVTLIITRSQEFMTANPGTQMVNRDIRDCLNCRLPYWVEPIPYEGLSTFKRREDEAEKIIRNIVVEMELGGTKADLERLLAEIKVEG